MRWPFSGLWLQNYIRQSWQPLKIIIVTKISLNDQYVYILSWIVLKFKIHLDDFELFNIYSVFSPVRCVSLLKLQIGPISTKNNLKTFSSETTGQKIKPD